MYTYVYFSYSMCLLRFTWYNLKLVKRTVFIQSHSEEGQSGRLPFCGFDTCSGAVNSQDKYNAGTKQAVNQQKMTEKHIPPYMVF